MNGLKSLSDLEKIAEIWGGMVILGVMDGSPAGRQGLRYGDILTQVGEHRVTGVTSFVKARGHFSNELPLTVIRDGEEIELVLDLSKDRLPPTV